MANDEHGKHAPRREKSMKTKVGQYLKLVGDAATVLISLRDRPTALDWWSAGFRCASIGLDWYTAHHGRVRLRADNYFENGWESFPWEYRKIVTRVATEPVVAPEHVDFDEKWPYACLAKVGSEQVGWIVDGNEIIQGPYYRSEREEQVFAELSKCIWKDLGGRHVSYDGMSIVLDSMRDVGVEATEQMQGMLDRLQLYLRAKIPRSYLLTGAPGTGKSVAIRWLTGVLGMTSVRVNVGVLAENATVVNSMENVLRILRPDVVILDDLDRIEVDAEVLAFLELARRSCRVVIASANHPSKLKGACLRPGRLDELIQFERLDRPVVEKLLGEYVDLVDSVADLPAAYVTEFANRCRVIGRSTALEGLDVLRERARESSEDSD